MLSINKIADPSWRLNNCYKIITKKKELITFRQNVVQAIINRTKKKRKLILKARQFGVSTNGILKCLDDVVFHRNYTSCILSHDKEGVMKLFRIPTLAYKKMNPRIQPEIYRGGGSKYEMFFPKINSRIYCGLASRGDTIHRLHISEAAFIKDPSRIVATLQTVPADTGEVEIESTPNGIANWFYDVWHDEDTTLYDKLFFPWFIFPDYRDDTIKVLKLSPEEKELVRSAKLKYKIDISHAQIAFRRIKKEEFRHSEDVIPFEQEYPEDDEQCFLKSGTQPIDLELLTRLKNDAPDPIYKDYTTGYRYEEYSPYRPGEIYVCGADPAEGVGGDFSVATIFEARTRKQVARLRGQLKPYDFAHKLSDICKRYQRGDRPWPLLAVERNNHGHAVLQELGFEHIQYRNLFEAQPGRPGWVSDRITRPLMIDSFIKALTNGTVIIQDRQTIAECLTLVNNNGKIEAAPKKHDDCVIAVSIALRMCLESDVIKSYLKPQSSILM